MSPARAGTFFDKVRDWQWIKHTILAEYLVPWAAKVGSSSNEIYVVDAFAGKGTYEDQDGNKRDGSPVISVLRARDYHANRANRTMHVICVEKHRNHHAALVQRLAGFDDVCEVHLGTFTEHAEYIAKRVGSKPALVLFDPIGVKGIDATTCRKLLFRHGKTDAFIVIDFSAVHRIGGKLDESLNPRYDVADAAKSVATIDGFFGSEGWRAIAKDQGLTAAQREDAFLSLYFRDVLGDRFRWLYPYPVRASYTGAPEYWLVHACDIYDGSALMEDLIAKVDRELFLRTYRQPGTIDGVVEAEYDAIRSKQHADLDEEALQIVKEAGHDGITFEEVRDRLRQRFFGRVKSGEYSNSVKRLTNRNLIAREARQRAKLQAGERLRIKVDDPTAPDSSADAPIQPRESSDDFRLARMAEELRGRAGYRSHPPDGNFVPVNPRQLAEGAGVELQAVSRDRIQRGEIAWPDKRLVKVRKGDPKDVMRENIAEGIAHIVLEHPFPSWFTYDRSENPLEMEARSLSLAMLIPEDWLEYFLFGTDTPKTSIYLASRFGVTVRAINEFLALKGWHDSLDSARSASALAP